MQSRVFGAEDTAPNTGLAQFGGISTVFSGS